MNSLPSIWAHTEPSGLAPRILGMRSWLASNGTLAAGDDAIACLRLLLADGLQIYARYDGDFRYASNAPDVCRLNLRAPSSPRNRDVLRDSLLLFALIAKTNLLDSKPGLRFVDLPLGQTRVFATKVFANPTSAVVATQTVDPGFVPGSITMPQAGIIPLIAVATGVEAITTIVVVGIAAALVAYLANDVIGTVDDWGRSRIAADVNLTRHAKAYAMMIKVYQDHANKEQTAGKILAFDAGEQAVIDAARSDLANGMAMANAMVAKLTPAPLSRSGTSSNILLIGLAVVAGFAYVQTSKT